MKLGPRQISLGIVVLVLLMGGLWGYVVHSRSEHAVGAYEEQLRRRGERLNQNEVLPPIIKPDQNGASLLRAAFAPRGTNQTLMLTNAPTAMRMIAPGQAMVGWAQPDILDRGLNSWEELEQSLADSKGLQALEQLIERPNLDFQLDYREGFSLLLPHLAPMKGVAIKLSAVSMDALHRK